MNKKAKIFIASMGALVTSTVIVGTASTIAWFDARSKISFDTNVVGTTEGSYFAYGKGTKTEPYGINKPRHLYNLAWLTYLGYFENKDNDGDDVKGDTFYFELDKDANFTVLDGMENGKPSVIPPIGTEEHPFYGTFNGNGKTIKNFIISNDFDDFEKTPINVTEASYDAHTPEIVGFIGVIGAYPGKSYTYDTTANEFKNTHLENIEVRATTARSLAGIAAGYVNGPLNNITTDDSSLNIGSGVTTAFTGSDFKGNISDYGIVGYCTTTYKKEIKKISSQVYQVNATNEDIVADTSGTKDGWGGSIDMISVHKRLNTIFRSNRTASKDIYSTYESTYDLDGNLVSTHNNSANTRYAHTPTYNTGNSYYNEKIGSFVYYRNGNSGNANKNQDQSVLYMAGGHTSTIHRHSYHEHDGVKITDGTNYLTVASFDSTTTGTLGNLTTAGPTDATVWEFDGNPSGYLYVDFYYNPDNQSDYYYNGTVHRYYLQNNNGQLVLSSTPTTWTKTVGVLGKVRYVNDNKFINFNGTNWVLSEMTEEPTLPPAPTNDFDDPEPRIDDYPNYAEPDEDSYPKDEHGDTINEPVPTDFYDEDLYPEPKRAEYEVGNGEGTLKPSNYLSNSYQIYYTDNNNVRHYLNNQNSTSSVGATSSTDANGGIAYGWTIDRDGSSSGYISTKVNNTTYRLKSNDDGNEYTLNSSGTSFEWAKQSNSNNYYIRNGWSLLWWSYYYYMTYTDSTFKSMENNSQQYNVRIELTSNIIKEYNTDVWQRAHDQWEDDISDAMEEYRQAHSTWEQNKEEQYAADHEQWEKDKRDQYKADHDEWVEARDEAQAKYEEELEYYNTVTRHDHDVWENSVNTLENSPETTQNGPDHYDSDETGQWEYQAIVNGQHIYDTSYFPINVNSAEDVSKDNTKVLYEPTENNTGYFVGGGSSNLRFGKYSISDLSSNSYNSSTKKFVGVKTYNGSNINITSEYAASNFEKYDKTIEKLEKVMASNTDGLYGMHFYNTLSNPTKVDIKNKTLAKWASINNDVKTQYELLANSVDFNLKEKGIINFVAGTYGLLTNSTRTSDVDSFFTLHIVIRDGNEKITKVYEIDEILSDNNLDHGYVYKLTNGKYTTPFAYGLKNKSIKYELDTAGRTSSTQLAEGAEYNLLRYAPTGYTTVKFKTEWLKKTGYSTTGKKDSLYYTPSYAYYFEIPVNDGEFAMGNVETGNFGAYLMYLDIGASALSLTRTTVFEHFKESTYDFLLPLGVMFKDANSDLTFDYTNSLTMAIVPEYAGNVLFDRDTSGKDFTLNGTDSNVAVRYVSDSIDSLHKHSTEGGGEVEPTFDPEHVNVTDIYRLKYYDYNNNTGVVIITTLTDTYKNGIQQGQRTIEQKYADGSDVETIEVYNSGLNGATVNEKGEVATVDPGTMLNTIQINSINIQGASTDHIILEFRFTDKFGVSQTIEYSIIITNSPIGYSFEDDIEGYSIVITVTGGTIYVYVDSVDRGNIAVGLSDYTITINGEEITSSYEDGQEVIVIPVE